MTAYQTLVSKLEAENIAVCQNEPIAAHTSFKIGGAADVFIRPKTQEELCAAVALCKQMAVRYYLLGNGSNILFADSGFAGAVIDVSAMCSEPVCMGDEIVADAGVSLMRLCRVALANGLSGLEFAYGIPGSLGGALYMNAGAYGGEMKDVTVSVRALCADGAVQELPLEQLGFGYRKSVFEENGACILGAVLRLQKGEKAAIEAKMNGYMASRRDKQPLELPSAGSTFKRPEGAFAGALIDECKLKGFRVGGAAVSEKHGGFVVNMGGATCADVLALCEEVSRVVKEQTGYTLEREVRVVE